MCVSSVFVSAALNVPLVPYSRTPDFQLERAEARQVAVNFELLWEVNTKIATAVTLVKTMKTMKTIPDNHSFFEVWGSGVRV